MTESTSRRRASSKLETYETYSSDTFLLVLYENPSMHVAKNALVLFAPCRPKYFAVFKYTFLVACVPCLPCLCSTAAGQGRHGDQSGAERCRGCPQAHAVQRDATRGYGSEKSGQEHGFAAQLSRQRPSGIGYDSGAGHTVWHVSQATIRRFLRPPPSRSCHSRGCRGRP